MEQCEEQLKGRFDQLEANAKPHTVEEVQRFLLIESEVHEINTQYLQHALACVVFSAMAVEGYIFDYAALRTSKAYVEENLDKMDTVAKWVVVPRLITGKELGRGRHCMQLLDDLVKTRNKLVHYKSRDIGDTSDAVDPVVDGLPDKARKAIQALNELAKDLDSLDSTAKAAEGIGKEAWGTLRSPHGGQMSSITRPK